MQLAKYDGKSAVWSYFNEVYKVDPHDGSRAKTGIVCRLCHNGALCSNGGQIASTNFRTWLAWRNSFWHARHPVQVCGKWFGNSKAGFDVLVCLMHIVDNMLQCINN